MFCEPFETGHLLYVCQQVGGMKWPKWSLRDLCPLSWAEHVLLFYGHWTKALSLELSAEKGLRCSKFWFQEKTANTVMLVLMINKLKTRACHVLPGLQKAACIFLLSTELVWELGFVCLVTSTSELNKWVLCSVLILVGSILCLSRPCAWNNAWVWWEFGFIMTTIWTRGDLSAPWNKGSSAKPPHSPQSTV